jgi:regulator of replication initiation timing
MGFDPRQWPAGARASRPITGNLDALLEENAALKQEVLRLRRLLDRYEGSPEKVNLESASKKGDPLEPAARSSRCSYLRLQRHSTNTQAAFIDQEKA